MSNEGAGAGPAASVSLASYLAVGVDPGVTTGAVLVQVHSDGSFAVVERRQFSNEDLLVHWLNSLPPIKAFVVEDFLGSGHRTKEAIHTISIIGMMRMWGITHGIRPRMQPPQWRKPFVKSARELLDAKHSWRHAADALAHVMAYDYKKRKKDEHQPQAND